MKQGLLNNKRCVIKLPQSGFFLNVSYVVVVFHPGSLEYQQVLRIRIWCFFYSGLGSRMESMPDPDPKPILILGGIN
jgi:hypothetical protein